MTRVLAAVLMLGLLIAPSVRPAAAADEVTQYPPLQAWSAHPLSMSTAFQSSLKGLLLTAPTFKQSTQRILAHLTPRALCQRCASRAQYP